MILWCDLWWAALCEVDIIVCQEGEGWKSFDVKMIGVDLQLLWNALLSYVKTIVCMKNCESENIIELGYQNFKIAIMLFRFN